jgi:hypothetical protein
LPLRYVERFWNHSSNPSFHPPSARRSRQLTTNTPQAFTDNLCAPQIKLLALGAPLAAAVTSIDIKGADFINTKTNDRFQLLGVAYQPGGSSGFDPSSGIDPLSDGDVCLRDAALMQQLGAYFILYFIFIIKIGCGVEFSGVGKGRDMHVELY